MDIMIMNNLYSYLEDKVLAKYFCPLNHNPISDVPSLAIVISPIGDLYS